MFSRIVRRTHMYLALFLAPWLLMYALSTVVMNHRGVFIQKYGRGPVPFQKETEFIYDGSFPDNAAPRAISQQLLASLGFDGSHGVNRRKDGAIVINRNDLVTPRRITYTPSDRKVVVERIEHRTNALLERFHRRRGYETGYTLDTIWAVSVDLFIAGMIFWALSGLWMWWELKVTRRYGAIAIAAGIGLFAMYLVTI